MFRINYIDFVHAKQQQAIVVSNRDIQPTTSNTTKIDQILAAADDAMQSNLEFQNSVNQRVAESIFVKQQTYNYLHDKVNLQATIEAFLSRQTSQNTQRNYRTALDKLSAYTQENNLSVLRFTPADATQFINGLYQTHATRTIRLTITACAQFFKYLLYTHPELQIVNPFLMTKLPRIVDHYKKDWPTKHDLSVIQSHFKKIGRLDLYAITKLIAKHGWRAGILTDMHINSSTLEYTSTSKGSQKEGRLSKADFKLIQESNLLSVKVNTLQSMFCRHTKRLFQKGLISCAPSLHDIRRHHIDEEIDEVGGHAVLEKCYKFHDNPMTTLNHYVNKERRRSA